MAGGKIVFKGDASGLKAVSREIINMADKVKGLNQSLTQADTALMENAKQIGYMSSSAKSTTKQLSEMVAVVKDLTVHYNSLTAAEKSSPYGKVLQGSISQLTDRAKTLKDSIDKASKGLQDNGNVASKLSSILGGASGTLLKLTGGFAAIKKGLDIVKDAFMSNEMQADEWNMIVKSSESVYQGFINVLNNGDFSGFLSSIDTIVKGAREAYEALDDLGTRNAVAQVRDSKHKAQYTQALADYKENPTAANKKTLDAANKAVLADLNDQATRTQKAYEASLKDLAQQRGLRGKDVSKFVNLLKSGNYADFVNAKQGYSQGTGANAAAKYWNGNQVQGDEMIIRKKGQPTTRKKMSAAEYQQYKFAAALAQTPDDIINNVQSLGSQAFNLKDAAAQQMRQYNRLAGNNKKVPSTTTTPKTPKTQQVKADLVNIKIEYADGVAALISPFEASKNRLKALQDAQDAAFTPGESAYYGNRIGEERLFQSQFMSGNVTPISGSSFMPATLATGQNLVAPVIGEQTMKSVKSQGKEGFLEKGNKTTAALSQMNSGIQSIADAFGGEMPETFSRVIEVLTGIATIVGAVQAFLSIFQTSTEVTKISLLAGIQAACWATAGAALVPFSNGGYIPKFAEGGRVGGSSFAGDHILARLNSGEVVLNSQQSGNILYQLSQSKSGGNNGGGASYVSGEKIFLGVNNYLKRTGKGEIVTTR